MSATEARLAREGSAGASASRPHSWTRWTMPSITRGAVGGDGALSWLVPYLDPYQSCRMRLIRLLDVLGERG